MIIRPTHRAEQADRNQHAGDYGNIVHPRLDPDPVGGNEVPYVDAIASADALQSRVEQGGGIGGVCIANPLVGLHGLQNRELRLQIVGNLQRGKEAIDKEGND